MRVRFGAAAVLVLLVMTGCSDSATDKGQSSIPTITATPEPGAGARAGEISGTPNPAAASLPDPCVLVTKAEAEKALGQPSDANAIVPATVPGQRSCGYGTSEGKLVSVAVFSVDTAAFDKVRNDAKGTQGVTVTDVAGLGDAAFAVAGAALYVRKGGRALSLFANNIGTPAVTDAALKTLATTALGRM